MSHSYTTAICSACGEPIVDGCYLRAFEMDWHSYHLVCNMCGVDFSDGKTLCEGPDGYAYCEPCNTQAFCHVCPGCQQIIQAGNTIEAMDKIWHPQCFKCPDCPEPFNGRSFFPSETGFPMCEKHYYASLGLLCCVCNMPITQGKKITDGGKTYHAEHFCCARCKKHLVGFSYRRKNDNPYCLPCYTHLFT